MAGWEGRSDRERASEGRRIGGTEGGTEDLSVYLYVCSVCLLVCLSVCLPQGQKDDGREQNARGN